MKDIIVITGPRGSGKTTAAAHYVKPTKKDMGATFVIDSEDSFSQVLETNKALGFEYGYYLRAYDRFSGQADLMTGIARGELPWVSNEQRNAVAGYYQWLVREIDKHLTLGKFNTFIFDTIEPVEAALAMWAETNKAKSGWSGNRAWGRLETEAVRPLYENFFEAIAARGVSTIILTSHLKQPWEGDKPVPNKVEPGGRLKVLARLSRMMFWLVPDSRNADGAPAALVLKSRLDKTTIKDGKWVTQQVLPRRIPHFTWEDVRRYQAQPADLLHPKEGEVPTPEERQMISEMLSDEQMRLMMLQMEQQVSAQQQAVQVSAIPADIAQRPEWADQASALIAGGATPAQVAAQLGVSVPAVIKATKPTVGYSPS